MTGLAVSVAAQARACLSALCLGVLLGVLYDAFFLLRALLGAHTGKRGKTRLTTLRYPLLPPDFGKREPGRVGRGLSLAITAVLDFLYALTCGILFLLFTYAQSEGVFRFYCLLAAALGFFLYARTLGRAVSAASASLVFLLRLVLAYLFLFIRVPLLWLLRVARRALLFLFRLFYLPLYGRFAVWQIKRRAARAFLPPRMPL